MPKPPKTLPKHKQNLKRKTEPARSDITSKKSYWIILTALLAVVSAVFGYTMGIGASQTVALVVTVVVLIGFVGFIRVNPSSLTLSKRATFIFAGASIIGFCIWAAVTLSGALAVVVLALGQDFYVLTSLTTCLTAGAFIGELLGRNKKIQERLFLNMK